jgi:hypothetical protein
MRSNITPIIIPDYDNILIDNIRNLVLWKFAFIKQFGKSWEDPDSMGDDRSSYI